jgi:hypothetical protein
MDTTVEEELCWARLSFRINFYRCNRDVLSIAKSQEMKTSSVYGMVLYGKQQGGFAERRNTTRYVPPHAAIDVWGGKRKTTEVDETDRQYVNL